MRKLIIDVPNGYVFNENETKRFLAAKMYESGKLSLGQASELAGLSKMAFAEILSDFNISLINYNSSDVLRDVTHF